MTEEHGKNMTGTWTGNREGRRIRIRNDDIIRKEQEGGTDVKQIEFRIVHGMK